MMRPGCTGGLAYPATNPYVVSVGGTTLTRDPSVPRGWDETAWSGVGSGCSAYEAKPAWQQDVTTGCPNRAVSDISADADPDTGLAVYDSFGYSGWLQAGGSDLASALVAGMYALAGPPAAGTYPASYPYQDTDRYNGPDGIADLNDITTGSDGSCGTLLCNAGPGWDGPTGLGTPNGVGALMASAHGYITGRLTSAADTPVAGATVSAPGGYAATTDARGDYTLAAPPGSYTITAQAFGYTAQANSGVQVTADQATAENFTLATEPTARLSGTVTDGSGHGWPLYAKITISGDRTPVYTNPYTGAYSVTLPQGATYQVQVTPLYPGYATKNVPVTIGTGDQVKNLRISAGKATCDAPGYAWSYTGAHQEFTGWGATPQDGWTVTNGGTGQTWQFSNPGSAGTVLGVTPTPPLPAGDADFAIANSVNGNTADTTLVSPVISLSGVSSQQIGFDTAYNGASGQTGEVDLSVDGGQTWTSVWQPGLAGFGGIRTQRAGARGHSGPAGRRPGRRAGPLPLHRSQRQLVGNRQRIHWHPHLCRYAWRADRGPRDRRQHR